MNVRRTFVYALLSLLLLVSQQMGISHGLTHWAGARAGGEQAQVLERSESASKSLALDHSCNQCLAFAQIASALDTPFHSFPAARVDATAVVSTPALSLCQRTVCVFQSRAPPVLS
ncbi:hypothetical protein ACFOLJ_27540 [Rugamonas sp. CCM 8940]|uniref:hypothetical protein n=1 Tax=Rugamonas sp. CCM 8940 TaxID=2765359 RepID=UPI0018F36901|nr:hypothetical protein [Rugamonas sp. CCM 8940]